MKFNTEQPIDHLTVGECFYTTSQTVCLFFFQSGYPSSGPASSTPAFRPEDELEHLTKKMLYDMENPPSDDYFGEQCYVTSACSPFLYLLDLVTGRPGSCTVNVVTFVLMDLLSMLGLEV